MALRGTIAHTIFNSRPPDRSPIRLRVVILRLKHNELFLAQPGAAYPFAMTMDQSEERRLGLAESIGSLRRELAEAIAAGAKEDLRFEVGEIELQLTVTAERSREGSGGVKFWVVDATGGIASSDATTHTITIPLTPRPKGGGPTLTGRG